MCALVATVWGYFVFHAQFNEEFRCEVLLDLAAYNCVYILMIIFKALLLLWLFFMRASCHYKPQRDKADNKKIQQNYKQKQSASWIETYRIVWERSAKSSRAALSWAELGLRWVELSCERAMCSADTTARHDNKYYNKTKFLKEYKNFV